MQGQGHSLLLEIVLARAAGLAAGEGALVVALAGVDAEMAGEVATGGEATVAGGADVLLLLGLCVGGSGGGGGGAGVVEIGRVVGIACGVTGHLVQGCRDDGIERCGGRHSEEAYEEATCQGSTEKNT